MLPFPDNCHMVYEMEPADWLKNIENDSGMEIRDG